jgi:phosphomannomutase
LLRLNVEARTTEEVDEVVGQVSQQVEAQNASDNKAAT